MQIRRLVIDDHKCLVDFSVKFHTVDGGSSTILIGENGTGKSTMLETLLDIFMSFDSLAVEKQIDYSYELEYLFAGSIIQIYHSDKRYKIDVDHKNLCVGTMSTIRSYLKNNNTSIFPERIMYFYSGANNKVNGSFKLVNSQYIKACRDSITQYWNTVYLLNHEFTSQFPKRKYNFFREELTPIYLASILAGEDSFEKRYLHSQCHIERVESVSISLDLGKLPGRLREDVSEVGKDLAGEDSFEKRYLHSQCHIERVESVSISLDLGKLPGRLREDVSEVGKDGIFEIISFIDDSFTELFQKGYLYDDGEKFYFQINGIYDAYADQISIYELLEKLLTLFDADIEVYVSFGESRVRCSDLSEGQRQLIKILGMLGVCKSEDTLVTLFDADIEVYVSFGESRVRCSDLSEGQRQLIKILGMLGVCKSEDTLVLMDEPDAHMNPKWKYDLKQTIDQSLQEAINTQAIIATHDPLVINGVGKEFIRIFMYNRDIVRNNNWYFTRAVEPEEDTAGMGIDGILQSEYYGLNSTLDAETKSKLEEKRDLLVKRQEGTISPKEQEKLHSLTEEIEDLTFSRNIPTDDLYDEFVVAMHKLQQENPISELTQEQIQERNRKTHEIIKGLMEK